MTQIHNNTQLQAYLLWTDDPEDHACLTIILKGTFHIVNGRHAERSKIQIPIAEFDEFNDLSVPASVRIETDLVPFKPKADVVLVGKAHVPHGKPKHALMTTLSVGNLSRTIAVFGNRHWIYRGGLVGDLTMSDPELFTEMDLVYERSFGGMDLGENFKGKWSAENPMGRGFIDRKRMKASDGKGLPNLEDPHNLIRSWTDRPKPVGYGFYGRGWKPRVDFAGTYGPDWEKNRAPKLPLDFRYEYYNGAHPDLQMKGYLTGDERVTLINLSPDMGHVSFHLPGVFPKISIALKKNAIPPREIRLPVNLDTLCFLPEDGIFYQVWRGYLQLDTDATVTEINVRE